MLQAQPCGGRPPGVKSGSEVNWPEPDGYND